jgi:hypothetical protein
MSSASGDLYQVNDQPRLSSSLVSAFATLEKGVQILIFVKVNLEVFFLAAHGTPEDCLKVFYLPLIAAFEYQGTPPQFVHRF